MTIDQPILCPSTSTSLNPPSNISLPHIGMGSPIIVEDVSKTIDPSVTWEDIDWLRGLTGLPVVLKGILTAEDAVEAVRHGVQGIIVSNHGGRQLDGVLATVS